MRSLGYPRNIVTVLNSMFLDFKSDLERDYAGQRKCGVEQLAVFVATTQLLASYSCVKYYIQPNNAVRMYCGGIKREMIYRTLSGKFSCVCHESPAGIYQRSHIRE